jgi:Spy/CpxP family protein refolding chaperone
MRGLIAGSALAAAVVLGACSSDKATGPTTASALAADDYAFVMFGSPAMALQGTLGPQGNRPFDGTCAGPRFPEALQLTDDQKAQIQALRDAFKAAHQDQLDALRAIFERARDARQAGATRDEVRAILEEGRAIHDALRADVEALHTAIVGVLTAEQRAWLEANRLPRPNGPGGREGPGPRHGRPPQG